MLNESLNDVSFDRLSHLLAEEGCVNIERNFPSESFPRVGNKTWTYLKIKCVQ